MGKFVAAGMVVIGLSVSAAAVALAQEDTPEHQNPVGLILADHARVPYDEIADLHELGYGWGSIWRGLYFSEVTGMDLEEALAQAREAGWGNLYRDAGLHPGMGGHSLGSLVSAPRGIKEGTDQPGVPAWARPEHPGSGRLSGVPAHVRPKVSGKGKGND